MTIPLRTLNRFLCLTIVSVLTAGCTKYPYENEIQEFYYKSMNKSVDILDITIDTTVSHDQAKILMKEKLDRQKERLKIFYRKKFERLAADEKASESEKKRAKEMADSADAGLFSGREFEIKKYNDFMAAKFRYEQLTVKYKLWSQGEVVDQVFISRISAKDTTLQITDKDLADYLSW